MLVEVPFWNITASCTTMYTAHQTKMRPDDFGDATNAILPSYASLQLRDINIVHLLLWLWRKQQIKEGFTLISGSMKLTPHLHDAKHFRTNLSSFNGQGPGRGHFSLNIMKWYFKVAQRDRGHFRRFRISTIKLILSFINFWPPIQPNLDKFVPDLKLCVDCYAVGQVNQDRRLPFKPAQPTERCPENALAFRMGGQKSSRKGPKTNVLTSPNTITF